MPRLRDPQTGEEMQLPYGDGTAPAASGGSMDLNSLSQEQLMMLLQLLMQEQGGSAGNSPGPAPDPFMDELG